MAYTHIESAPQPEVFISPRKQGEIDRVARHELFELACQGIDLGNDRADTFAMLRDVSQDPVRVTRQIMDLRHQINFRK